jgi:transcriptional regulator with XRE-family HTH domain
MPSTRKRPASPALRETGNNKFAMRRSSDRAIGLRLRVARLLLGVTEREAADACGVTLRTYRGYEDGRNRRGNGLEAFARKYGCSLRWLFYGDGSNIRQGLAAGSACKLAILPAPGPRHRRPLNPIFQSWIDAGWNPGHEDWY